MDTIFKGTGVALITPFNHNKEIDFDALNRMVNHCTEGQVEYLVALGTTGECATLSHGEQDTVRDAVIEMAGGRIPVVLGIGGNETRDIADIMKRTDFSRIQGVLSVTPYYNKPTQAGLTAHYKALAEYCKVPMILYNVPGRTGVNMTAGTTLKLANEVKQIVAIKEASGNLAQIMEIIQNRPQGFAVLSGDDALALPIIAMGGEGVISVAANAFPLEVSTMVRHMLDGRIEEARTIHYALLDFINALFVEGNPCGIKAATHLLKLAENELRLPLVPISEGTYQIMEGMVRKLARG